MDTKVAHSPTPKTKPLEVVPDATDAGYVITLSFNAQAEFTDLSAPADMNPLLTLEHLTLVCHWLAHELVSKARDEGKKESK